MRYKLFTDQKEAESFAKVIEGLCSDMTPKLVKYAVWIEWMQRWAVSMEREPEGLTGEIVDTLAPAFEGGDFE